MKPRAAVAILAGCLFLIVWVAGSMILSDYVLGSGTALELAYFAAAGSLWVLPVTWLMLWASRSP